MKHVALVTCLPYPTLSDNDSCLIDPLRKQHFIPHVVAWDDPSVDWTLFDHIVIRSCWNYPKKYEAFKEWLSHLEQIMVTVANGISTIRWNTDKSYLFDMEKRGASIIPTHHLTAYAASSYDDFIIKPKIGNRSQQVYRSPKHLEKKLLQNDYIIQPYISDIDTQGEYRFIFIGNEYSHTVKKTASGIDLIEPSDKLISQARALLSKIRGQLLYARIDAIPKNGELLLLEAELVEPDLFFDKKPEAATLFAQTLKKQL